MNKNIKNLKFIHDYYQEIPNDLTVREIGLTNNANIIIKEEDKIKNDNDAKISLTFKTTLGTQTKIIVYRRIPIGIALIIYLLREEKFYPIIIDLINGQSNIVFLYNACRLRIQDKRNVGEIFGYNMHPTIVAYDVNNLIGG